MQSLSNEVIEEFKSVFELFDKKCDGHITTKELNEVIESLGRKLSYEDLIELIREVDLDGNGVIDFNEFIILMKSRMRDVDFEEEMEHAFSVFDKDGKGYVDQNDLKKTMGCLGEPLSDEEVRDIMKEFDDNLDGSLNFQEFKNMIIFR